MPTRVPPWNRQAGERKPSSLFRVGRTADLPALSDRITEILSGKALGRTVVELH